MIKTVWKFFRDLKIDLVYDAAIPLLEKYPNKMKSAYKRVIYTCMYIAIGFTVAKI